MPAPATVRVRHPGSHASGAPLAIGPYATGGIVHEVTAAIAERLLSRGFERVSDTTVPPAPAMIFEE